MTSLECDPVQRSDHLSWPQLVPEVPFAPVENLPRLGAPSFVGPFVKGFSPFLGDTPSLGIGK
eukprot:14661619-Heterocapsa_arctica.AAC.1